MRTHRRFPVPAPPAFLAALAMLLAALPGAAQSQVPDHSVTMSPGAYDTLFTRDVFDDAYLPAPFTSNDTTWPEGLVRFKGNSTRYYAKKSYRVRFATTNLHYGYRQMNYNSMYTDKSFLREKLAWDLFADVGALAPAARHATFAINGESKGLYLQIPKVDRYLLALNGRPVTPMYEADDLWNNADLTVQPDSLLKRYWAKEIGPPGDYSDLAGLIAALNSAPDGSFADTVRRHFDTASVLRWFAVNTLTMMGDSYNKNYLLYRDTTRAAQQWTVIPWDYDLSWGRTGDLAVPYPASLLNDGFAYTFAPLSGPSNVLKDRFEATPGLWDGFRTYLAGVLATTFTESRLWPRIDSLAALVRPDAAADPERWGTMRDFDDHVEALKYYVTARRNFLQRTFIDTPSGEYNTATLPFAGEGTPHHFVAFDGRLLGTLWFSGASGLDSVTVRAHPEETPPDVLPPFDGRWVDRWVEVVPHPATAQFTAKFRWAYQHVSSTDTEVGVGVGDERLLRAWQYDRFQWNALAGRVNPFANTVTIDSLPSHLTGGGQYLALMLSDTYDRTWERQANNYWERWHDVRFTDSLRGFVVGEHGSFLRTTDGGDTWERDSIGSALHFLSAASSPATGRIVAAGESGYLYHSDDTGRTWTNAASGIATTLRGASFDGAAGVVAGDAGRAFHSPDGGSAWYDVPTGLADDFTAAAISGGLDGAGNVFVTAGPSVRAFLEQPAPPPAPDYALTRTWPTPQPTNAVAIAGPAIWVAGDSGYVAFAAYGDPSLTERSLPVPDRLRAIAPIDSQRIYVAGDGGAIWHTADAGLTWYRQLTGDTHDLYAIAFTGSGRGFAVGNGGTILRTDLAGTLTGIGDAPPVPSAFRLLQNYPNPFNPATTIAFELPVDAFVSIEVFDVLGRNVGSAAAGGAGRPGRGGQWLGAGRHEAAWDAGGHASGVYFYRMHAADRAGKQLHGEVKKMVLVR